MKKDKSKLVNKKCPIHGNTMCVHETDFGKRWMCTVKGCTMVCWSGATSTPADLETRNLRQQCHVKFDALPGTRYDRYKWLSNIMKLKGSKAHIGMFNAEQCKQLLKEIENVENQSKAAG